VKSIYLSGDIKQSWRASLEAMRLRLKGECTHYHTHSRLLDESGRGRPDERCRDHGTPGKGLL